MNISKYTSYVLLTFALLTGRSDFAQQYLLEPVITGLTSPVAFTFLPNDNVILTQRGGLARIFTLNNVHVSNFWNFSDSTVTGGEKGLL